MHMASTSRCENCNPFLQRIIIKWKRLSGAKTILAASTLMHEERMRLRRQDQDGLWLLR